MTDVEPPFDDKRTWLLDLIKSGEWLDEQIFPELKWAVPNLVPEGFGILTGAPKIGKSWAALSVGLAVSTGGKVFDHIEVGDARPVLYLALEDGNRRLQARARHLLSGEPIPSKLHFVTDLQTAPATELMATWLEDHGPRNPLVMLDTLGKVMPPAGPGESEYQRDYRIGGTLKRLVDAWPGSTLLVVHHVRKQLSGDWMDSTSGTNGLNGAADFTINLGRDRNSDQGVIRVTGRDVTEAEYAMKVIDGLWSIDGKSLDEAADRVAALGAQIGLGDDMSNIVRFVCQQPEPVDAKTVATALGLPIDKTRTYLGRLKTSNRLNSPKRGHYSGVSSVASVMSDSLNDTHITQLTPALAAENQMEPEKRSA